MFFCRIWHKFKASIFCVIIVNNKDLKNLLKSTAENTTNHRTRKTSLSRKTSWTRGAILTGRPSRTRVTLTTKTSKNLSFLGLSEQNRGHVGINCQSFHLSSFFPCSTRKTLLSGWARGSRVAPISHWSSFTSRSLKLQTSHQMKPKTNMQRRCEEHKLH